MKTFVLILWVFSGGFNPAHRVVPVYGFTSLEACEAAGRMMEIKFRCLEQ